MLALLLYTWSGAQDAHLWQPLLWLRSWLIHGSHGLLLQQTLVTSCLEGLASHPSLHHIILPAPAVLSCCRYVCVPQQVAQQMAEANGLQYHTPPEGVKSAWQQQGAPQVRVGCCLATFWSCLQLPCLGQHCSQICMIVSWLAFQQPCYQQRGFCHHAKEHTDTWFLQHASTTAVLCKICAVEHGHFPACFT